MKNNDTFIHDANRTGIDRCGCPLCNGAAGTRRVCFNTRKLAARLRENPTLKKATLLLLTGLFLQARTDACVVYPATAYTSRVSTGAALHTHIDEIKTQVGPEFYQSNDNPFRAD
jgi:hypothetical protein